MRCCTLILLFYNFSRKTLVTVVFIGYQLQIFRPHDKDALLLARFKGGCGHELLNYARLFG